MAIYSMNVQIIGRGQGKSAVAAAAYRSGNALYSEHQDIMFDYSRKGGVAYSEIILPETTPAWMLDREKLWNAVELFEKRKDATYAREMMVALPAELSFEQNKALLREYITDNFVSIGMIADYSIHEADSHNPHAHIMLTLRPIINGEFGKKERAWNDKKFLGLWREQWAAISNKHLALAGIDQKISHLSYAARGIDLEPTMHRGYMARENQEILDRFQRAKAIQERNYEKLLSSPDVALDILTHHQSIFSHHDLSRFINERTDSGEEFISLKIAIETCDTLVSLGQGSDGKTYYTSHTVLQQEQGLIERAGRLSQNATHRLNPDQFGYVLASRTLNPEQQSAFEHILEGNDLSLVVGFAGTGKSYLMDAVREAYESMGYRVVGTALSGRAADGLAQSAQINSRTIARFLIDWENGREQLTDKTVLIIDEAGMVGSRQLNALLSEADRVGAKVIACGDPEQIPPVEAGCPFRYLLERTQHVFLKQVVRQQIDWQREATIELSTQQHHKAIDRYHTHGHIHAHQTREQAIVALVDRWHANVKSHPEQASVMMSYRNADVLAMNLLARERLQVDRQLSDISLVCHTKAYGELSFVVGDHIMFLRNEKSLTVKNGLRGKIQSISGTAMTVAMDRGDTLAFDIRDYNDLGYGYASTIHKFQGETVDCGFVLATPHYDRFITNVSLDRHRSHVELHYGQDDFASYDNLKRVLSRGDSKVLAVEFAQARGVDYPIERDSAAVIESKKDFANYYRELLDESVPIQNTVAEDYLKKQGIGGIETKNIRFHPAVWERETQQYMPALLAKAIGEGREGVEVKGVQVTFLDATTKEKANIAKPVRYSGSPNAIIMLQKPEKADKRWYLASDIETALVIAKAKPDVRVACLAMPDQIDQVPLQAKNKSELIFCPSTASSDMAKKAASVFASKGFAVKITQPIVRNNALDQIRKVIDYMSSIELVDSDRDLVEEIDL